MSGYRPPVDPRGVAVFMVFIFIAAVGVGVVAWEYVRGWLG